MHVIIIIIIGVFRVVFIPGTNNNFSTDFNSKTAVNCASDFLKNNFPHSIKIYLTHSYFQDLVPNL